MWPDSDNSDTMGKLPVFDPGKFINNDCPKPKLLNPSKSCFFDSLLEIFAAPILLDKRIMSAGLTEPKYFQSLISLSLSFITPGAVLITVDLLINLKLKVDQLF